MARVAYRSVRGRRKFVRAAPSVKRELGKTLDNPVKPDLIKLHEKRTANWRNKPDFKGRKFIRPDSLRVIIFPAGENKMLWIWNVGGTKPHPIRARNAPRLAFIGGGTYTPKTTTRGGFGGSGTTSGGSLTMPIVVQHPGTEPRPHVEKITAEYKQKFNREMENAFRRAIRRL